MARIDEAALRVKSRELHIPFSNLLPAAVMEHVLWLVNRSEWKERLWLRNGSSLGPDCYRRKPVFTLSFYYKKDSPQELFTPEMLEEFFKRLLALPQERTAAERSSLLSGKGFAGDRLSRGHAYGKRTAEDRPNSPGASEEAPLSISVVSVRHQETDGFRIDLEASMGMIRVPVKVQLEALSRQNLQPEEGELRLMMQDDQVIRFPQYPSEQIVAEHFVTILEKMELINDLTPYQELYGILGKEAMDGRRLQLLITEEGRGRNLTFGANRLATILSYENYTYMKKKWKAYLKREQRKTPLWEDVMKRMGAFFPPLWDAIVADRIYIGDWMPELQRFLE